MNDRNTDRLLSAIAASPDPRGPDRLVAGYVESAPLELTDDDRDRIAKYKARAVNHALAKIGAAFRVEAKPVQEEPERFDEFTGGYGQ